MHTFIRCTALATLIATAAAANPLAAQSPGGLARTEATPRFERLSVMLDLDAAQQPAVMAILQAQRTAVREVRQATRPQFERIRNESREQLAGVLSAEQMQRLEALHQIRRQGRSGADGGTGG